MSSRCLMFVLLLSPACLMAQSSVDVRKDSRVVASKELEAVILEAKSLNNKNALVIVESRAAMLVSFSDPLRSDKMFLDVWKFINEQTDNDFDTEQAKLVLLRSVFSRNPKLGRKLLAEQPKADAAAAASRTRSEDNLTVKLASQLVDTDASAAAQLLEHSLSISANPAAMGALNRLREKDPLLSDYVAGKAMDALGAQPTLISLPGLHWLATYIFPGPEAPVASIEAQSSLDSLQFRFFLASLDVLQASLKETNEALVREQHYTQTDLQFRAAFQARIAAILAALAPRLRPSLGPQLTEIAGKLAPQMPANLSQLNQLSLARLGGNQIASEDPEQGFLLAMSSGDFVEARTQLEKISSTEKRDAYSQLLIKTEARALIAKTDVIGALTAIRKLDDPTTRLVMYLEAVKACKKKHDTDLLKIIINEARLLIPLTDRNGLHLRVQLSFVAQLTDSGTSDDAMELLNNAVITMNALRMKTHEQGATTSLAEAAMIELNDPNSLLDAPEMEGAFTAVGLIDLERGLAQATRIEVKPVQLVARLETIQGVIKKIASSKAPARSANVSSAPR